MAFLGIGLFAGIIVVALTIARDEALKRWIPVREFEEAMEFASFRVAPHPVYPNKLLLWIALALAIASIALLFITNMFYLVTGLLTLGMALFLIYDHLGERITTEIIILPEGILFEPSKKDLPRFYMPYDNIVTLEIAETKITLVLKSPKLANRLPIKSKHAEELAEKIEAARAKFS